MRSGRLYVANCVSKYADIEAKKKIHTFMHNIVLYVGTNRKKKSK